MRPLPSLPERGGGGGAVTRGYFGLVQIPGATACLNVASAGTVVMYDRAVKP